MPIYEYRCKDCGRRVSLLILNPRNSPPPRCPHCSGERLERLLSRFARLRSEDERLERLTDPSSLGGIDENDPASVARYVKRMGQELGEDMGEDLDAAMEEAMGSREDAGEDKGDTGL